MKQHLVRVHLLDRYVIENPHNDDRSSLAISAFFLKYNEVTPLNKTALIEAMIIFVMGIMSMVEGIRLTYMEKIQLYDVLGPGRYNFGVGLLLIIVALIYFISRCRKHPDMVKQKGMRITVMSIILALIVYCFLINIIGYFLASVVFFCLIHWVMGYRSWLMNGGLSIGISISFYVIFVHWLNMIFPRGILFNF